MSTILIVVVLLILIGLLPTWPYSSEWGYYPSSGAGLVQLITRHFAGDQGVYDSRGAFSSVGCSPFFPCKTYRS